MKQEKGFSLIELVVVLAIMAVMLAIVVPSARSIAGSRAMEAAEKTKTALDYTKTEALSRISAKLHLYREADGVYVEYYIHDGASEVFSDREKIGEKALEVICLLSSGEERLLDEDGLIFTYNRADGSLMPLQRKEALGAPGVSETKGVFLSETDETGEEIYAQELRFYQGSREYRLLFHRLTGTYEIRREE